MGSLLPPILADVPVHILKIVSMIVSNYLSVLGKIYSQLKDCKAAWVISGSLGMVLQGMEMDVHDIDIQTDKQGAFEIEKQLSDYVVVPVQFSPSERICSYLGRLDIDGVKVEIMGDLQKRIGDQTWEVPVRVESYRRWVHSNGMEIPVLSLEYEYQAYLKLGRLEKAERLRKWLQDLAKKAS